MPSIASHYAVAKVISEKINVDKFEFYKGSILPDVINECNSHKKIRGKYYMIPDIVQYAKNNDLTNDLNKGYLCHLLLDKYFLEEYIINVKDFGKTDIFDRGNIYKDYTNANKLIIDYFDLDVDFINKCLDSLENVSNYKKLNINKKNFNNFSSEKLEFIEINSFVNFLNDITDVIIRDLESYM